MNVTRMDLDGTGSPAGLVTKILAAVPDLKIPVPIDALARQLDISEIQELTTEGFEGGPLTDEARTYGAILVRKGVHRHRRRFTVGHELGHFLMPFHRPARAGEFLCSSVDMRRWSATEQDRQARMEVEANQFAALMLMPPPHLRRFLDQHRDPDLSMVLAVHHRFDVSKEAAARACAQYHGDPIAIVVVKDLAVVRIYSALKFPPLSVQKGQSVPRQSLSRQAQPDGTVTELREATPEDWLRSTWGTRLPALYEQVLHQQRGFAMILLAAELAAEEDEDDTEDRSERMTSRERYRDRLERARSPR